MLVWGSLLLDGQGKGFAADAISTAPTAVLARRRRYCGEEGGLAMHTGRRPPPAGEQKCRWVMERETGCEAQQNSPARHPLPGASVFFGNSVGRVTLGPQSVSEELVGACEVGD